MTTPRIKGRLSWRPFHIKPSVQCRLLAQNGLGAQEPLSLPHRNAALQQEGADLIDNAGTLKGLFQHNRHEADIGKLRCAYGCYAAGRQSPFRRH